MIDIYRNLGLKLRKANKGPGSLESGILRIQTRLTNGTFKVFETCVMLLEEMRRYHRDENGKVVERVDDLIAALRYAEGGLKHAKTEVEARGDISGGNVTEVNFFPDHRRYG